MERWNGLTDLDGGASFPTSPLKAAQFLPSNFNPTNKNALVTVTDLEVEIPASGLYEIDGGLVIHGDPTNEDNFTCFTLEAGEGTQYTPIDNQAATLSSNQVRVRRGTGRLDFPVADAGNIVYITFRTSFGGMTAALAARMYGEIVAMQAFFMPQFVAGQAWDNQAMYVASDGKAYVTDVANADKQAWGWGIGSGAANDTVTLVRFGVITPTGVTPPKGTALWIGQAGTITWEGDSSGNELVSGDYIKEAGVSFDGSTVQVNLLNQAYRQYP